MFPTSSDVQRFLAGNTACREALIASGLVSEASYSTLAVQPLGQGEHNINFLAAITEADASARANARADTGASATTIPSASTSTPLFVVRINAVSQLGLASQIGYEFSALKALAASALTPKPLFADTAHGLNGFDVLVEEYVPGTWMDFSNESHLQEVAKTLALIHSIDPYEACEMPPVSSLEDISAKQGILPLFKPVNPLREQLDECSQLVKEYRESGLAQQNMLAFLEKLLAQTAKAVEQSVVDDSLVSIINTEAVPSHFLIAEAVDVAGSAASSADSATGAKPSADSAAEPPADSVANTPARTAKPSLICHMVDWEKAILGNPAQDVAYFLSPTSTIWDTDFTFDKAGRERFVHDYCTHVSPRIGTDGMVEALSVYAKTNALRGLSWSARAWTQYQNPNMALRNEKTARKLDVYLDPAFHELCVDLIWS